MEATGPSHIALHAATNNMVRRRVLRQAFQRSAPGGLLVVAEKVTGHAWNRSVLVDAYHGRKRANGYTPEQVNAKAKSLRSVMHPVTAARMESEILATGWQGVECIWRCLNFGAWVAIKPNS